MYHQAHIPKLAAINLTTLYEGADQTYEPHTSFRLQSHQDNSDICLSSLLFHHQRQRSHVQTPQWSEICCTELTTVNWKLGGQAHNGTDRTTFPGHATQLCNTKIT